MTLTRDLIRATTQKKAAYNQIDVLVVFEGDMRRRLNEK